MQILKDHQRQGYSNLTLQGMDCCWFPVLPDNELHPPGVPGLNQSLITGENKKTNSGTGFEIQI